MKFLKKPLISLLLSFALMLSPLYGKTASNENITSKTTQAETVVSPNVKTIKNSDGSTSQITTSYEKNKDGSISTITNTVKTAKDGTVTKDSKISQTTPAKKSDDKKSDKKDKDDSSSNNDQDQSGSDSIMKTIGAILLGIVALVIGSKLFGGNGNTANSGIAGINPANGMMMNQGMQQGFPQQQAMMNSLPHTASGNAVIAPNGQVLPIDQAAQQEFGRDVLASNKVLNEPDYINKVNAAVPFLQSNGSKLTTFNPAGTTNSNFVLSTADNENHSVRLEHVSNIGPSADGNSVTVVGKLAAGQTQLNMPGMAGGGLKQNNGNLIAGQDVILVIEKSGSITVAGGNK